MRRFAHKLASLVVCATLVTTVTVSTGQPVVGATDGVLLDPPSEVSSARAGSVVGSGSWLEKAACIACVAGFGIARGGTVAGVLLVAGTVPELVVACAMGCARAFDGS